MIDRKIHRYVTAITCMVSVWAGPSLADDFKEKAASTIRSLDVAYMFMRRCHEMNSPDINYVSDNDFARAKNSMQQVDREAKESKIDTELAWAQAVDVFKSTVDSIENKLKTFPTDAERKFANTQVCGTLSATMTRALEQFKNDMLPTKSAPPLNTKKDF